LDFLQGTAVSYKGTAEITALNVRINNSTVFTTAVPQTIDYNGSILFHILCHFTAKTFSKPTDLILMPCLWFWFKILTVANSL
jgi:hypothetical protein